MGILESQEPNYHNLGFFGPLNMFSSKATQAQTNLSIWNVFFVILMPLL